MANTSIDTIDSITVFKTQWNAMNATQKQAFVTQAVEREHERRYNADMIFNSQTGPAWSDLTPDQQATIRLKNYTEAKELTAFITNIKQAMPAGSNTAFL